MEKLIFDRMSQQVRIRTLDLNHLSFNPHSASLGACFLICEIEIIIITNYVVVEKLNN